ncbi:Ig-like domain-containing protein [Cytobacillus sp. FJAT-53684]|uniref:Ig-like domain-containing protein n=1 Tax=Cytobacillus mangrovibacter TaxID=3299024 RepID=A0ABW6JX68_9BACI
MKKRFGILLSIAFVFAMIMVMPNSTNSATNDTDVWSAKKITDNKKVWTIAFSQPLKESTIKNTTVYVEDGDYRLFFTDLALSSDKKSIIVTPKDIYKENTTYRLNITKEVASEKGKKLEKAIIQPFVLNGEPDETTTDAIKNVTFTSKNFATMVSVTSNDAVNKVTANSKELLYEGNNKYSIGLTGVASGDTVKIQAFDISGKRLFSKDYKVN